GDIRVVESAPLVRCSGGAGNTYPPTSLSCPSLVATGVKFARTVDVFRGAQQARLRDSFISTDSSAHAVTMQYQAQLGPPPTGTMGYVFPQHGGGFAASTPDQVVSGLGSKAGTIFVRSDIYAGPDESQADTIALTWSRPPSKVQFSHSFPNL